MNSLNMKTEDITEKNIENIAKLFPNVITEKEDLGAPGGGNGKIIKAIDFDLLKQQLSKELVEEGEERYTLNWPGKKASLLKANTPIEKTLRPSIEDSVDFDKTENLYIEGDNFEVLKILQESYLGKVKMIYIDPPYNTGKDFVYKDNFTKSKADANEEAGVEDEDGGKLFKNTDTNGRFHSDWLSMMYERLTVARDLLKDDGVIFMSIDENEIHNLRKIADEIFGEENFINTICVNMSNLSGPKIQHAITGKRFPKIKEYILLYVKDSSSYKLSIPKQNKGKWDNEYSIIIPDFSIEMYNKLIENNLTDKEIIEIEGLDYVSLKNYLEKNSIKDTEDWKIKNSFRICASKPNTALLNKAKLTTFNNKISLLRNSSGTMKLIKTDFNKESKTARIELVFAKTNQDVFFGDNWIDIATTGGIGQEGNVPFLAGKKPLKLLNRLLKTANLDNDIILDFFSGSSSTAHAVMSYNIENNKKNKFLMVQISEKLNPNKQEEKDACKFLTEINKPFYLPELGKERIRRAGKKIVEENKEALEKRETPLDTGFRVYKTDSSNMKDVFYHPSELVQSSLLDVVSNIKEDRSSEDLLTQVILDLGLTLDMPIEKKTILGNEVYFVAGNSLVACFDENINFDIVDEIAKEEPLRVVFRDSCFKTDSDRINFENKFKKISPESDIRVI